MPPLDNFGVVFPHPWYRCAQPDPRGFADLRSMGVTDILKLSLDTEYPHDEETALFGQGVHPTPLAMLFPGEAAHDVRNAVQAVDMLLKAGRTIATHCRFGRDRTGFCVAAYRILKDGWSYERAHLERVAFGTGPLLDATVDRVIVTVLRGLADG